MNSDELPPVNRLSTKVLPLPLELIPAVEFVPLELEANHVVGSARVNAGRIVIAGVVRDYIVVPAGDVDAGGVMMAGVVSDSGPGAGKPDSLAVMVAIVINDSSLRGILNADARMSWASGAFAARHADFVIVSGISIALEEDTVQRAILDDDQVHIDARRGRGINAVNIRARAVQRPASNGNVR